MGAVGLELVDVELRSGVLLVTVDRDGGVDLEALDRGQPGGLGCAGRARPVPRLALHPGGLEPRGGAHPADPGPLPTGGGRDGTVKTRPQVAGDRRLRARLIVGRRRRVRPEPSRCPDGALPPGLRRHGPGAHGLRVGTGPPPRRADGGGQRAGAAADRGGRRGSRSHPMSKPNFEFLDALGQIARDKGISVETLLDALANALVAAYKRRARCGRGGRRHHRPRVRRDPGLRPGAGRGRATSSASGTTLPTTSAGSPPRPPSRSSCSGSARPSATSSTRSTPGARATS